MLQTNKQRRPSVLLRYERFTMINQMIRTIQEMYDQTPTEKGLILLKQAQKLKEIWWEEEDGYREQELDELFRNFSEYAHSVRVAALDDELR